MSVSRRRFVTPLLAIGFVAIISSLFWPDVLDRAHHFQYKRSLREVFNAPIKYVEFQPNTDWPTRHLTDPRDIKSLNNWLAATSPDSTIRSAPPALVCEMRLVFADGREEVIHHSVFRDPLGSNGSSDVRSDVRVQVRRHTATGPTHSLAQILSPEANDKSK
jgi:hypothetical protein